MQSITRCELETILGADGAEAFLTRFGGKSFFIAKSPRYTRELVEMLGVDKLQAIEPLDKVEVETQPIPEAYEELMECLWNLYLSDGEELPKPVRAKTWEDAAIDGGICSAATLKRAKATLETRGYIKRTPVSKKEVYYEPQK